MFIGCPDFFACPLVLHAIHSLVRLPKLRRESIRCRNMYGLSFNLIAQLSAPGAPGFGGVKMVRALAWCCGIGRKRPTLTELDPIESTGLDLQTALLDHSNIFFFVKN